MAGREEAQAILSRAVHRWLGDFAGQVGIHARGYRLVDVALGAARAPAHATNRAVPFDHQRLAVQFLMHQPHEVHWCQRRFQRADQAHRSGVVRPQRPFDGQAEQPRQLHVVTHFLVHVERQVIGEQTDVVTQQGFQPALLHPDNARILVLPEVTVMHQHHIRLGRHRRIEQGLAGGHATDDAPHLRSPLDLQAVGTVVGDLRHVQITVGLLDQGGERYGHGTAPEDGVVSPRPRCTLKIRTMSKLHFAASFV